MSLRDAEIVRYSRQILLREVGGVGQSRLLEATVRVQGDGPAALTAAAYLRAGGSSVVREAIGPSRSEGFWRDEPDPLPEAPAQARGGVTLVARPNASVERGPAVVIGGDGADAFVQVVHHGHCLQCAAEPSRSWGAVPIDRAELVGALAALCVQRMVLGRSSEPALIRVDPSGALETRPTPPCRGHHAA